MNARKIPISQKPIKNLKISQKVILELFENIEQKTNPPDWMKKMSNVELLGILQYIGICPLYKEFHDGEYGKFLFLLGKYLLAKKISEDQGEKIN